MSNYVISLQLLEICKHKFERLEGNRTNENSYRMMGLWMQCLFPFTLKDYFNKT